MKLGNPVHVTGEVHQIRAIGARVTALTAGGEAILVDAGMRGSSPFIAGGLQALGLSLDAVRVVVISHRHPDHASGVGELVAGREIAVMAHSLEASILGSAERHPSPFQNRLAAQAAQPVLDAVSGSPIAVDVELEDGQTVPFPYHVQVVHLPGHTAGSIALFLPEQKLVIVGDALQYKLGRKLSPPAAGVTEDPALALQSLRKLLDLDFDALCFSHFPPMRSGAYEALGNMLHGQAARQPGPWDQAA